MLVHKDGVVLTDTAQNRVEFFAANGITQHVVAKLEHGANVQRVSTDDDRTIIKNVDGLVTTDANLALAVTVADCFPVYVWDEQAGVIGIAHAGWRGVVKGVVPNLLREMFDAGATKEALRAVIGPGIRACHFEVQNDVFPKFSEYDAYIIRKGGKIFVDLSGIIAEQLCSAGVSGENIHDSTECTFEDAQKYSSYRRDGSKSFMVSYIYRFASRRSPCV